jgi:hypothetical protein
VNGLVPVKPADVQRALTGGTIESAQIDRDGSAYLIVVNGSRTLHVFTFADPEGNGPGFLHVEEGN